MDVSVIVLVFKVETFIEKCAYSLFNQTLDNIEYIFVDDCSPDSSMHLLRKIMEEYPERTPYIKILTHQSNQGSAVARNTGLRAATGRYIGWVDSDDWVEENMFQRLYEEAENRQSDIIWCDFYNTYPNTAKRNKQNVIEEPLFCLKSLLSERMNGVLWNKLVKRELYNNIVFAEHLNMWEDLRVTIQLFSYAHKVSYLPEALYHYVNYRADPIKSVGFSGKMFNEIVGNAEGIIAFIKEHKIENIDKELNYLKLAAKRTLLLQAEMSYFIRWKNLYPESNKYIWSYSTLPLRSRFIGWCASFDALHVFINVWIYLKKTLKIDK